MILGVSVRIHEPPPELSGYVTFFYFVTVSKPIVDFLYPEWGNVRFSLSGDWHVEPSDEDVFSNCGAVFGPTDRRGLIWTSGGSVVGFGLTPFGWHAIVRTDASSMLNRTRLLTDQMGAPGELLLSQLQSAATDQQALDFLSAALIQRMASQPAIGDTVRRVDAAFRRAPSTVSEFSSWTGLSSRTLQRVCLHTYGFAPKRLLRLQRFLRTLGHVRAAVGEPLSEGLGREYYDQSQFYRDFKEFMQMTPRSYLASARQVMAAAAAAQAEAGVTLSFELPPAPD